MSRTRTAKGEQRGSLKARLVLFVALPAGLLGLSYFLFVEYVLESQGVSGHGLRVALRIGGLSLVAIALVLAAACGFLLAERVTRPIRLLLRLAESGDVPATRTLFLHHRDWEVFLLYRRVLALVQQNQAGAKTLEELEALHSAIEGLHRALRGIAPHGMPPPLDVPAGPLAPVVEELESNRQRLVAFVSELQGRVARLRGELDAFGQQLARAGGEKAAGVDPAASQSGERECGAQASGAPESGIHESGAQESGIHESGAQVSGAQARNGPALGHRGESGRAVGANGDRAFSARHALEELRRVGTVLSLNMERARESDGSIGTLYDRFTADVDAIEIAMKNLATEAETAEAARRVTEAELRAHHRRLEECLGGLERRLEETGQ